MTKAMGLPVLIKTIQPETSSEDNNLCKVQKRKRKTKTIRLHTRFVFSDKESQKVDSSNSTRTHLLSLFSTKQVEQTAVIHKMLACTAESTPH